MPRLSRHEVLVALDGRAGLPAGGHVVAVLLADDDVCQLDGGVAPRSGCLGGGGGPCLALYDPGVVPNFGFLDVSLQDWRVVVNVAVAAAVDVRAAEAPVGGGGGGW